LNLKHIAIDRSLMTHPLLKMERVKML